MPENRLWAKIKAAQPGGGIWKRIETPSTGVGFPDTLFTVGGVTGLAELKWKDTLERGLGTTAKQRKWLADWVHAGGEAWLMAVCKREFFMIRGGLIPEEGGVELYRYAASIVCDVDEIDWNRVCKVIKDYSKSRS